ncbi:hypothetical protein ACYZTX_00545 [Pseudomonas sp. MDT1-17]
MYILIPFIPVSMLAVLLTSCTSNTPHVQPQVQVDTGMEVRDIRIRADQVTLVRTASVGDEAISVILYSHLDPQNTFSFIWDRVHTKAGYSVDDYKDQDKRFTALADWNGRHYSESTQFPTYAHFVIKSLTEQETLIEVSARLVEPDSGDFINLPLTLLRIQGAQLRGLTGKPRVISKTFVRARG